MRLSFAWLLAAIFGAATATAFLSQHSSRPVSTRAARRPAPTTLDATSSGGTNHDSSRRTVIKEGLTLASSLLVPRVASAAPYYVREEVLQGKVFLKERAEKVSRSVNPETAKEREPRPHAHAHTGERTAGEAEAAVKAA